MYFKQQNKQLILLIQIRYIITLFIKYIEKKCELRLRNEII